MRTHAMCLLGMIYCRDAVTPNAWYQMLFSHQCAADTEAKVTCHAGCVGRFAEKVVITALVVQY